MALSMDDLPDDLLSRILVAVCPTCGRAGEARVALLLCKVESLAAGATPLPPFPPLITPSPSGPAAARTYRLSAWCASAGAARCSASRLCGSASAAAAQTV